MKEIKKKTNKNKTKCPLCQYMIPQPDGSKKQCGNHTSCVRGSKIVCHVHLSKEKEVIKALKFDALKKKKPLLLSKFALSFIEEQLPSDVTIGAKSDSDIFDTRIQQSQLIREYLFKGHHQYPLKIEIRKGNYNLIQLKDYDETRNLFSLKIPPISVNDNTDLGEVIFHSSNHPFIIETQLSEKTLYLSKIEDIPVFVKLSPLYNARDLIVIGISNFLKGHEIKAKNFFKSIEKKFHNFKQLKTTIAEWIYDFGNNYIGKSLKDNRLLKKEINTYITNLKITLNKKKGKLKDFINNNEAVHQLAEYLEKYSNWYYLFVEVDKYSSEFLSFFYKKSYNAFDPKFQHCRAPIEDVLLENNASNLVSNQHSPFFPILYGTFLLNLNPTKDLDQEIIEILSNMPERLTDHVNVKKIPNLKNFLLKEVQLYVYDQYRQYNYYQTAVMEKVDSTIIHEIGNLINKNISDENLFYILKSITVQILLAIYSLKKYRQTHNNIDLEKITLTFIDPKVHFYFILQKENKYYQIPSYGYQVKLINFEKGQGMVGDTIHECNNGINCRFDDISGDVIYSMGLMYKLLTSVPRIMENEKVFTPLFEIFSNILICDKTKKFNLLDDIIKCESDPIHKPKVLKDYRHCFHKYAQMAKCERKCDTTNPLLYLYNEISPEDIPSGAQTYEL